MVDKIKVLRRGSAALLAAAGIAAGFSAPASADDGSPGFSFCNDGGYLLETWVEDSSGIIWHNYNLSAGKCNSFKYLAPGTATVKFADGTDGGWFYTTTVNASDWPCYTTYGTIFNPSAGEGCH